MAKNGSEPLKFNIFDISKILHREKKILDFFFESKRQIWRGLNPFFGKNLNVQKKKLSNFFGPQIFFFKLKFFKNSKYHILGSFKFFTPPH